MTDLAIKKRLDRAKSSAIKLLEETGYGTVISDNKKACLIGFRRTETRVIRVVITKPTPAEIDSLRALEVHPDTCIKEIWQRDRDRFKIIRI